MNMVQFGFKFIGRTPNLSTTYNYFMQNVQVILRDASIAALPIEEFIEISDGFAGDFPEHTILRAQGSLMTPIYRSKFMGELLCEYRQHIACFDALAKIQAAEELTEETLDKYEGYFVEKYGKASSKDAKFDSDLWSRASGIKNTRKVNGYSNVSEPYIHGKHDPEIEKGYEVINELVKDKEEEQEEKEEKERLKGSYCGVGDRK
ncbi:hypothetical protein QVD17_06735 [Tagetes erecta]|uniref:Uncharacterized protein n=1 Tax=Tagetes erecta TaxID=13708 RepID=A0AAD8LG45_TARER|nr:hypothetical protein QVD17_06735 [Tagetes erecta]